MRNSAKGEHGSSLRDLIHARDYKSMRESSWDKNGFNNDWWPLENGETKTLAQIEGPGLITHIWFTINSEDAHYMRRMLIRIYWDDETDPSVDSPIGDFFGQGHCKVHPFQSLPLNMTGSTEKFTAMNCFFPMPFRKKARIEIVNETTEKTTIYFHIDYEKYDESLADDILYFHAKWRRENPTDGWMPAESVRTNPEYWKIMDTRSQLTDEGNYLVLEAEGKGHYVGCNLSVHNLQGSWWGEGDDMMIIDGEPWPPRLHGTGTEDYFGNAWRMQPHAFLYHGASLPEEVGKGRVTCYRYHIEDPVNFEKSIRISIEHCHANAATDDYASVAYWYQTEPHKIWAPMLPVEDRLPRPE